MGLHGLLALVEHFVTVYEVPGELLEGKIGVLFEVVSIAYVSSLSRQENMTLIFALEQMD